MAEHDKPVDKSDLKWESGPLVDLVELPPDTFSVRLLRIGYALLHKNWGFPALLTTAWRLYFPLRPGFWLDLRQGRFRLEPQRVHLIPSGIVFSAGTDLEVPHLYIHFDVIGFHELFQKSLLSEPVILEPSAGLQHGCEQLIIQFEGDQPSDLVVRFQANSLIHAALAELLQNFNKQHPTRMQQLLAYQNPVAPAVRYIEEHIRDEMTNEQLASLCYFSHDHFVRRFKEATGQTPAKYIQSRRVALAAQRLLYTEESIDRIAEEVGFADRFYFSRVFVRQMGIGPAAYRRAIKRR